MNDRPIRVCMIMHGYLPLVGGAERQVASLAPFLQKNGVEMSVITRRSQGLAPRETIDGVPVHRLAAPGPKSIASVAFTVAALSMIRKMQPDLLHAHILFSPATIAIAAKQLFGFPVVATPHRSGPLGDIQRLRKRLLGQKRIRILCKTVDAFFTISEEIDRELAEAGVPADRRFPLPNGVDPNQFKPLSENAKQKARVELGLECSSLVIYAGRLAPEKRVDHLISVWPEVLKQNRDALLIVLGEGSEESRLKQMAGERIRFLGRIGNVAPYLSASDVFVLPSVAEGFSVAILEALASGVPAIVTEVGGAREMIQNGTNGLLIPPDDPPALQEAILKLLLNNQLARGFTKKGRDLVIAKYSLDAIAQRMKTVYSHLIQQNKTRVAEPLHVSS